eukprot:8164-Heterococcus_DN1.PRE.11
MHERFSVQAVCGMHERFSVHAVCPDNYLGDSGPNIRAVLLPWNLTSIFAIWSLPAVRAPIVAAATAFTERFRNDVNAASTVASATLRWTTVMLSSGAVPKALSALPRQRVATLTKSARIREWAWSSTSNNATASGKSPSSAEGASTPSQKKGLLPGARLKAFRIKPRTLLYGTLLVVSSRPADSMPTKLELYTSMYGRTPLGPTDSSLLCTSSVN